MQLRHSVLRDGEQNFGRATIRVLVAEPGPVHMKASVSLRLEQFWSPFFCLFGWLAAPHRSNFGASIQPYLDPPFPGQMCLAGD